jgi:hypothetical protein
MSRTALLPTLVLSLGLLLSGCGGSDESESEPEAAAEPLSKAEFVTEANAICGEGNAELESEVSTMPDEPSDDEIEEFAVDVFVPNLQGQHDDIAALGVPTGDEADVDAILASMQDGIDAVDEDPQALLDDDDPFNEFYDLAEGYGMKDCAS